MRFIFVSLLALFVATGSFAKNKNSKPFKHPLYVGVMGGYGSTTWQGLVPAANEQNEALNLSTPINAREGGGTWGVFAGFEVTRFFAIEGSFIQFPDAVVTFDEFSLFSFEHDGKTRLETKTHALSLIAKIMMTLPNTSMRIFSGAGVSRIERRDLLVEDTHLTPSFSVGANVGINQRVMAEVSGNYTAGYGESALNPADKYIPFLYSVMIKLAYLAG